MLALPKREGAAAVERFEFYGCTIEVRTSPADFVEEVRRDFAYFHVPPADGQPEVHLQLHLQPPPYADLPSIPASVITPRNVCFRDGKVTYIDYFGRGLAVLDRRRNDCVAYAPDPDLLHEIAYLFVLSTVGKHLDKRGIHRVHALGISYQGRGVLLLLPSGGGKSTLALELLRHPGVLLLGEDTPLVDRRGDILPFPLRLGVRPGEHTGVPPRYLRTVRRMEFEPKTLIDIECFQDRLGQRVAPGAILVGARNLGEVTHIEALAKRRAFKAMVKYLVVGLGVYQGLEFLLERGAWELLGEGRLAASRLHNSVRLLARAPTYRFVMGRNAEKNCQTLCRFLSEWER
jgi:hypothetical protein